MNRNTWMFLLLALSQTTFAQTMKIKVDGDGHFRLIDGGKLHYAKSIELTVLDGRLAAYGAKLVPSISLTSLVGLTFDMDGTVRQGGTAIGRLVLALFTEGFQPQGEGGLLSSSSRPIIGNPGEGEFGVIRPMGKDAVVNKSAPNKVPEKDSPQSEQRSAASLSVDVPAQKVKATNTGKAFVTIRDRAEMTGESITLGLIADITGPESIVDKLSQIELGTTPPIAVERIIDRSRVLSRIKIAGIDMEDVTLVSPEKIRVSRMGQTVKNDEFVAAAIRGAQLKGYSPQLEATTPGPDFKAQSGELELVCESVSGNNTDLTVSIGVYVDGKRQNSRMVKLRSTLPSSNLKVGTIVTVRVKSGAIAVESKGKVAKVDPSTGAVTVVVAETGATLTGTLAPDGSVEVKA